MTKRSRQDILKEVVKDISANFIQGDYELVLNYDRIGWLKHINRITDDSGLDQEETDIHTVAMLIEQIYRYGHIVMDD